MIPPALRGLDATVPFPGRIGRAFLGLALGVALLVGFVSTAHADVTKAKAHYERGQALYQVGEYRRALDEFKEAHVEKPDPAFLYNIAQCFRQLADKPNALTFYRRYLVLAPDGAMRGDVERRIHELESSPSASTSSPPSAHEKAPGAGPPRIRMESAPVTPAIAPSPSPNPADRTPLPRWLPWAGAGATVVLGIIATATGLSASSRFDELRDSCGQTTEGCTSDQIGSVRSRARTANVLFVLAGVAALGTGVTVYVNTREAGLGGIWRF